MKYAHFVTLVCFLTLTLTLFTRPAFANSITWLGVETQTNFYINIGPSGSTLSARPSPSTMISRSIIGNSHSGTAVELCHPILILRPR